jgi:hypothetical protein
MDHLGHEPAAERSARAGIRSSKAERRAARQAVGEYHERELGNLLEHVRNGFARYDAGEIDAFDLDDVIHRHKRSAQKLWSFCTGSAQHVARISTGCASRARRPTGGTRVSRGGGDG